MVHRQPTPATQPAVALPDSRGPLSAWVLDRLRGVATPIPPPTAIDPWGEDTHLALFLCHDLHLGGFDGVDAELEWDSEVICFRRRLERSFVGGLVDAVGTAASATNLSVTAQLLDVLARDSSPSISTHIELHGTLDHMRDVVVHRSAYQLAEGDMHTFAIPRVGGPAKRSLAAIQAGEYGADAPGREMHAVLFARTMRALGLDDRRHAYLAVLPSSALAISNLISTFALQRRWRGALVGQLAAFELTSVTPMGRYASGLRRLGAPEEACRFYDVHVLADAEHELWAMDMVEQFVDREPALRADVLFGVAATIEVERRFAEGLMRQWETSVSERPFAVATA
jgi:Iron-containing redox enzyme